MTISGLEKTIDECQESYLRTLQRALDKSDDAKVRLPLLGEYKKILASYSTRNRYEKAKEYHEYLRRVTGQ